MFFLEKIPWASEKNVYSAVFVWRDLQMSVGSISAMRSFNSPFLCFLFFLEELSITAGGIVKLFPTIVSRLSCNFTLVVGSGSLHKPLRY